MLGLGPATSQYESVNTRDDDERPLPAARPGGTGDLGATVYDVVRDLRRDVEQTSLPLRIDGALDAEESRRRLLSQLDEHLLPRLKELSSPAIVVVAGSTGAGKSTLYNSILGEEVSPAGVLRPTTREPVLAYNPEDEDVFAPSPATELSRVIQHAGVPRGTALLDAPDLDSLLAENRQTATTLLEAADLWLFVTTAARYGDALPWQTLAAAKERGASVAMVLNRVPRANLVTIRGDLLTRLREHGMENTPLFVVPDIGPHEGLLDAAEVAPISRWLTLLAGPDRSRAVIVRTLKGSLAALPDWVTRLGDAVEDQAAAARRLRAVIDEVHEPALAAARRPVQTGNIASGAVASRWAQLSAERVDRVSVRRGRARSSTRKGRARDQAMAPLLDEVVAAVVRVLVAGAVACDQTVRRALLDSQLPGAINVLPEPVAATRAREARAEREAAHWAAHVIEYVTQLADPVGLAAVKALGSRGLSAVLAAAAVGQDEATTLARAVLSPEADHVVPALHQDLAERAVELADQELAPLRTALADPALGDDAGTGLRLRLAELRRLT